jgi:hypothetical protein
MKNPTRGNDPMDPLTNELSYPPRWLENFLLIDDVFEPIDDDDEGGVLGFI